MSERLIQLPRVQVRGTWRDIAFQDDARIRLDVDALQLTTTSEITLRVELESFAGTEWRLGTLTLHGRGAAANDTSDVLELSGDALLADLWVLLGEYACILPELTRAMRSLGSRHGGPRLMQERFFAPLLQARRRLEIDRRLEWRMAAFEAPELRARVEETLLAFAAEMHPSSAPDRRALEAELLDFAEGLMARLGRLHDAAAEVHASPDRTRYAAWRRWARAAGDVFAEADRCWLICHPLLQAPVRR